MIVLRAKAIDFEVTYINLREKPDWFLAISPHGKVPVLEVDGTPLFESNAIAEFLEEVVPPALHPEDPVQRARNRAWTDFVPDFSAALSGIYYGKGEEGAAARFDLARARLTRLEEALGKRGNDGPYFNGPALSLVDAAYAPFLQRFALVEERLGSGLLAEFPRVQAWSRTLLSDPRVTGSVAETFTEAFVDNLRRRDADSARLFA